jgi:phosphatidylserine decarboxylase
MNSFLIGFYYLLPKIYFSKLLWLFGRIPLPYPFNLLVFWPYIRFFKVDLSEVSAPLSSFRTFNQFFIRTLKKDARPFDSNPHALCSPVDGTVSCFGPIENEDQILQVKGKFYSLRDLLGHSEKAELYRHGFFLTVYLSPRDYHRIHAPCDSTIQSLQYIPGTLFPVNPRAVQHIPSLFPRNERLISYAETPFGEIALVKVGALNVGRMAVTFHPFQTNSFRRRPFTHTFSPSKPLIPKGEELGRFEFGSTIVLLLPHQKLSWFLQEGQSLKMGQKIAQEESAS